MSTAMHAFPHTSSWHCTYLGTGYVLMVWYLVKHRNNVTIMYFLY